MTITISAQASDELFQQENVEPHRPDPGNALDVVYKVPSLFGHGYWRFIQLRQGLALQIGDFRYCDRTIIPYPERDIDWLEYHFHFSGEHQSEKVAIGAGEFCLSGTGAAAKETGDFLDTQPYLEVGILMKPETLCSFIGDPAGELPTALQPLIRQSGQDYYCRTGTATPAMRTVAQQILQCPYQGIPKRLCLEGSAVTLMGLVTAEEVEIQSGDCPSRDLKPEVVDRIHHARTILLQRLANPPSLMELARLVGLNECTLKQGFRQVFDTTAFGYLQNYRLEQAQQLLQAGDLKVEEVAQLVGYRDRGYFASAFRKKFGYNPSALKRKR